MGVENESRVNPLAPLPMGTVNVGLSVKLDVAELVKLPPENAKVRCYLT